MATMRAAVTQMTTHGIRHLPVLDGERIAGLVRQDDLELLEEFGMHPFEITPVCEVMSREVCLVLGSTTLGAVVQQMQDGQHDHAVVLDRTHFAGIFTLTDALRLLALALGATTEELRGTG